MKQLLSVLGILGFAMVLSPALAFSQATTLWEIGKFDQSFREFHASPSNHVVDQVGKSDWGWIGPARSK